MNNVKQKRNETSTTRLNKHKKKEEEEGKKIIITTRRIRYRISLLLITDLYRWLIFTILNNVSNVNVELFVDYHTIDIQFSIYDRI